MIFSLAFKRSYLVSNLGPIIFMPNALLGGHTTVIKNKSPPTKLPNMMIREGPLFPVSK